MAWQASRYSVTIVLAAVISEQPQLTAFQGKQFFFDGKTAAVSGEFAVAANHTMTGNHDGNRIRAIGQPHGARGFGIADTLRQFSVRNCFAEGNFTQISPDGLLERRALRGEGKIEGFELTGKIGMELIDGLLHGSRV